MTTTEDPQPAAARARSPLPYIPQVDTLRTIAVATVMFEHYMPHQFDKVLGRIDGVPLFFAISGFLITGILLKYRDAVDAGRANVRSAFLTFYARRTLRIFPAYYALLIILLLSGFNDREHNFIWHFTYTTNIWTTLHGRWDSVVGHFWSLGVEEQFYLIWPFVALAAPRRWLPRIMAVGIAIGVLFRLVAYAFGGDATTFTFTLANLDPLLLGAGLAWAHHEGNAEFLAFLRKYGIWTLLLLPAIYILPYLTRNYFVDTLMPAAVGLIGVYLIDQCSIGMKGLLGWLFSRPFILYLGKISYGLYLFHVPVQLYLQEQWFDGLGKAEPYVRAIVWGVTTVIVASLSWLCFERPINSLKRYFYLPNAKTRDAITTTSIPSH